MKYTSKAINLSWQDVENACIDISRQIATSEFKPDIIFPVLWGGAIPARLLIDMLNLKRSDCVTINCESYKDCKAQDQIHISMDYKCNNLTLAKKRKILIIEEIVDSGRTIREITKKFEAMGFIKENIKVATLVWNSSLEDILVEKNFKSFGPRNEEPNFYHLMSSGEWIVFPWDKQEFFRTIAIEKE